jgi:hypothetical protein
LKFIVESIGTENKGLIFQRGVSRGPRIETSSETTVVRRAKSRFPRFGGTELFFGVDDVNLDAVEIPEPAALV